MVSSQIRPNRPKSAKSAKTGKSAESGRKGRILPVFFYFPSLLNDIHPLTKNHHSMVTNSWDRGGGRNPPPLNLYMEFDRSILLGLKGLSDRGHIYSYGNMSWRARSVGATYWTHYISLQIYKIMRFWFSLRIRFYIKWKLIIRGYHGKLKKCKNIEIWSFYTWFNNHLVFSHCLKNFRKIP